MRKLSETVLLDFQARQQDLSQSPLCMCTMTKPVSNPQTVQHVVGLVLLDKRDGCHQAQPNSPPLPSRSKPDMQHEAAATNNEQLLVAALLLCFLIDGMVDYPTLND